MLICDDAGSSKNACFALSCLATDTVGHRQLLRNEHSDNVFCALSELLSSDDLETALFAAT